MLAQWLASVYLYGMFKFITASVIAASALALSAAPVADADAVVPASRESVSWLSRADWVTETLADKGIVLADNVHVILTDAGNCGAQGESGQGGCTTRNDDGTITVAVSPSLAGTDWGNHILFHEVAHTLGYGECAAEAWAHVYEGNEDLWSYEECK